MIKKLLLFSIGMFSKTDTRIGIFFHQRLIAETIASVLQDYNNLIIDPVVAIGKGINISEIENNNLELLILELAYVSRHVIEMIENIRLIKPSKKILIVAGKMSTHFQELLYKTDGYVLKSCSQETLLKAVDEILNYGKYLCPQLMEYIINSGKEKSIGEYLTSRENEILLSWFSLYNTFEIAKQLNISQPTVRTHLKNIREKFGKPNLMKMLHYACQEFQFHSKAEPICSFCNTCCVFGWKCPPGSSD